MSKPLAFGLNRAKKPGLSKPLPTKRNAAFGGDDSDEEDISHHGGKTNGNRAAVLEIGGLDDIAASPRTASTQRETGEESDSRKSRPRPPKAGAPPSQPPKLKPKANQPNTMFGDLSSTLTARKNAEAAEKLDSSVYEYDAVYDSLKHDKRKEEAEAAAAAGAEGGERRSRYMKSVIQSAEVRKRDQLIANEKKIAREREAEGDEFEDKEKFVTEAYKRQQEENRRIEEEEKRREEEEAKKNKGGGMSAFYRNMLNRDEERHAQAVKAAEVAVKEGPATKQSDNPEDDMTEEQREAKRVRELNEKGASIAVNEDGRVVDKRQLLKAGLNVSAKAAAAPARRDASANAADRADRRHAGGSHVGGKQSMRERQSRMLAEQLEQSTKRSREAADSQREETERAAKSQKTEGDISSAKERYLARKRAAEEEKKKAVAGDA